MSKKDDVKRKREMTDQNNVKLKTNSFCLQRFESVN